MQKAVIDDLAARVCERLWAVFDGDSTEVHLLLPLSSADRDRVSEQESKIVMCHVLEELGRYYSIEVPTRQQYQQSGTRPVGARLDLTVYEEPKTRARALNIELKAGTADFESFRKDFEKLAREGVAGLWFHTLPSMGRSTLPNVLAKMKLAMQSVDEHSVVATHGITFVFCVLDRRLAFSAHLPLGADVGVAAERLFTSLTDEWSVSGIGAEAYLASRHAPQKAAAQPRAISKAKRDLTGKEKLLIYCPQITPDTFLHFSQRGDSYRLRAFTGTLAGKQPWMQPETISASEFLKLYAPEKTISVLDEATTLDKVERWRQIVDDYNRRHGIGA